MKVLTAARPKIWRIALALFFIATVGVSAAFATEYNCESSGNKCAIENSVSSITVSCMKTTKTWYCTLPAYGDMECSYMGETKKFNRTTWNSPTLLCILLCENCSSGWIKGEGGSSF